MVRTYDLECCWCAFPPILPATHATNEIWSDDDEDDESDEDEDDESDDDEEDESDDDEEDDDDDDEDDDDN